MPELPSVEIFKQFFESTSLKQEIRRVTVKNPEILINTSQVELSNNLQGQEFRGCKRYGKYLFAELGNSYFLIMHFGMNGYLKYYKEDGGPYIRLQVEFTNGSKLGFDDTRKFGKMGLTRDPERFIQEKKLGPDALEVDFKTFRELFKKRKAHLKALLLNQNFIAGIGNLYADEILYQCGIHPLSRADKLDKAQVKGIFQEMKKVLKTAIEYQDKIHSLPSSYLLPHRKVDGECPEGGAFQIIKVGGRTTYFCPDHQKYYD